MQRNRFGDVLSVSVWDRLLAWLRGFVAPQPVPPTPVFPVDYGNLRGPLLLQVDQLRQCLGLPILKANRLLNEAAQAYAEEMAADGIFSHQGRAGDWPWDRIAWRGYPASSSGEDIAWGQETVDQVFADWKNSPGHYAQMVEPTYSDFGAGVAADSTGRLYWTLDFAKH